MVSGGSVVSEYRFKQVDFESPSFLFALEDKLKGALGGPLLYGPYYRTFGLKGDESVLDFGCGGGAGSRCLASLLSERGHLTCVDVSHHWIEKARRRLRKYPNAECKAGDIRALTIPDASFDVISVFHVIHDIAPGERQETVNALCRKLKETGTVFVREPTRESHGMPAAAIRALFADAGLRETRHEETKSEYRGRFQS
jgi:ubiquinone/menaquinone biosynthesis C-methylase UbiE